MGNERPDSGALAGKVAIVTGAARLRGIGRAIALRLAEDGADVVATAVARPPQSLPPHEIEAGWRGVESVAEEISALGRKALALDVDVTLPEQVREMVERTAAEFGRIDILVNNAGLALVAGKKNLWEMADDEWFREIDVNLHGVYHCCKAAAKVLVEQGQGGKIVNISSLAGRSAQPQYGGYTPAKFAVIGLTQMLALELAPHRVNVNAVCPGSTDTDMMDGTFRRTGERLGVPFEMIKQGVRGFIPLGRQADPAEIAAVVAYLCSPQADYITGQAVNVDGGMSMR
ncbi:MAG: SDR family NAD(P)-dependent oxidoreductase [Dehalococcoidia bacterium]|nr:SDR family NAD(P)-dependent oxidoreductase [Dehalococcoidia bacterium]